jgi:hypothetical protein
VEDLRGLLESLIGMRLRLNLYRGNGAEKLSTEDAKQGKESYASSVARVAGSPVTATVVLLTRYYSRS